MFLATSDGAITKTPPTASGHYLVRVGEAATTANLAIQIEPPILNLASIFTAAKIKRMNSYWLLTVSC